MGQINVRFDNAAGSRIDVTGPAGPTDVFVLPRFVTDLSASHQRWTYQTTSTKKFQWTLSFQSLTTQQKNELETFFADVAKGPTNTFRYTHTDGTTYTGCRFVDTQLAFGRVDNNTWSVTVRLEVGSTINS